MLNGQHTYDSIRLPTVKLETIIVWIRREFAFAFITNDLERPQKTRFYWASRFNRKKKREMIVMIHKWFQLHIEVGNCYDKIANQAYIWKKESEKNVSENIWSDFRI